MYNNLWMKKLKQKSDPHGCGVVDLDVFRNNLSSCNCCSKGKIYV